VSPEAVTAVSLKADWDGWNFRQATKLIRRELAVWRRFSPAGSQARAIGLFLGDGWNKFARRKLGKCRVEKKVTLSGGRIIAFVGVDGAGKSTVKDEIYRWMGKQIESRRFYMGTGDGKVNPVARLLKKGARKLAGAPSSGAKAPQTDRPAPAPISFRKSPMGYLKKVMAGVMVSSVERDNERKMKAMNRYRLAGGVSLLDRYPQIELAGKNDGPKIAGYRARVDRSRLLDRLAQKEERRLALVREIRPDLIFRLNISAETSMARKPEQQDIETFRGKIQELRQITFQGARIVDIDAEQPFERELLEIKRIIWESF
jgi:thymidylate kinase